MHGHLHNSRRRVISDVTQVTSSNWYCLLQEFSRAALQWPQASGGPVTAGLPVLVENIEDYFPLPKDFGEPGTLFMLRVSGDSMIEEES